jgi:hypothetical protein
MAERAIRRFKCDREAVNGTLPGPLSRQRQNRVFAAGRLSFRFVGLLRNHCSRFLPG